MRKIPVIRSSRADQDLIEIWSYTSLKTTQTQPTDCFDGLMTEFKSFKIIRSRESRCQIQI
jgi:hypothetical protein